MPLPSTLRFRVPDMCCPVEFEHYAKTLARLATSRGFAAESFAAAPDYGTRILTVTVAADAPEALRESLSPELLLEALRSCGDRAELADAPRTGTVLLAVPAMDCPVEAGEIEREFKRSGIGPCEFRIMTRTIAVPAESVEAACEAVRRAGYDASPLAGEGKHPAGKAAGEDSHEARLPRGRYGAGLVFALLSEAIELLGEYGVISGGMLLDAAGLLLAAAAIFTVGLGTFRKGLLALSKGTLNMNTLMAVAVTGGVLIGAWPEAAMVMVLFEISEAIEGLSMARARRSIRDLMTVAPERALVKGDAGYVETPVEAVAPGARVRVAPGDRIPLDGRILEGSTTLDQSAVTGESMPVEKSSGDDVWAGTVNLTSTIEVLVTKPASMSLTARIIEMVENAQASKSRVQRFVDRFAAVYTPLVFLAALLVVTIPPLFFGGDFLEWLYKGLCLLVIACPCALVISTPVTIVSALATATRCGLLIKGGLPLEEARRIRTVALDKTGTLTKGEPRVERIHLFAGLTDDTILPVAASLAAMNKHPLSRAIVRHAEERNTPFLDVVDFTALPGRGVKGRVRNGEAFLVNLAELEEHGWATDEVREVFRLAAESGRSTVALADAFGVEAVFELADEIRPDARAGLDALRAEGIEPVLLTGDNRAAALALGHAIGLPESSIDAELLPDEKLEHIRRLQERGFTAMVGDGINDAPALAQADLGIAMGIRGTDSAIEAADVALMDDRISSLAALVRLSRFTHSVLVQNIVFALGVKFVFAALALAGHATMWMAVFADTGTCLIVVANGLRLLRAKSRAEGR